MMESFFFKVRELVTTEETDDSNEIEVRVEDSLQPNGKHFECLYCFEVFTSKEDLIPHERAHRSKNQYICKWCNGQYTQTGWEYHYRKHTNDKRFKCESCDKSFYTLQQLQSHLSHHKYSCTFCDQTFVTIKQIKSHERLVHNFNIFSDFVGLKADDKRRNRRKYTEQLALEDTKPKLEKMIKMENSKSFEYPKVTQPENIHRIEHSSEPSDWLKPTKPSIRRIKKAFKSFLCKSSDTRFPKMVLLRFHMKKYRNCRPYWCNDCKATFSLKKELEKHVRRHLYKCESCSRNFSCKHDLDMHFYNKHMLSVIDLLPKPEIRFRCHYCGRNWSSEEDLRNHIKLSGEDVIICSRCFDTFDFEIQFVNHLKEAHQIE